MNNEKTKNDIAMPLLSSQLRGISELENYRYRDINNILELDDFIYSNQLYKEYHTEHIKLAEKYAFEINRRLGNPCDNMKISMMTLAHDLLKESGLKHEIRIYKYRDRNIEIPTNLNSYVRTNLNVLEKYGLDEYFNTDASLHGLAAGIFLSSEFDMYDKEILYPIMFHSCPILKVYRALPAKTRLMIDIMVLSDKLSSNWIKKDNLEEVVIDLDAAVFGLTGKEFHFDNGVYLAKIIGNGTDPGEQAKKMTEYYFYKACLSDPLLALRETPIITIKELGGKKIWPQRESLAFQNL